MDAAQPDAEIIAVQRELTGGPHCFESALNKWADYITSKKHMVYRQLISNCVALPLCFCLESKLLGGQADWGSCDASEVAQQQPLKGFSDHRCQGHVSVIT